MSDIQTFVATESDGSQWVSLAAYEAAIHHLSASREEVAQLREEFGKLTDTVREMKKTTPQLMIKQTDSLPPRSPPLPPPPRRADGICKMRLEKYIGLLTVRKSGCHLIYQNVLIAAYPSKR
jgi:hypothetical protein